ncbi:MAG: hypothetical protein JXO51_02275 [Candidatus Aminicenantes bacterium]|nr:hypothetical protein [Candidatus Aminicenantes bacterium]
MKSEEWTAVAVEGKMGTKKAIKSGKKPYQKPELRRVSIGAGVQTLGLGCKTIDGYGSLPVTIPCWANGCAQEGS